MKRLFLLALAPVAAHAWDPAGHMLVGQIAWTHAKPATREKVAELVQHLDNRFNESQQYNFITAGCWMDDMRALGRDYQWGPLHYVTIPWTESGEPAEIPPAPNIVTAIDANLATLRDPKSTFDQRVEAVGMLLHFVGDIHQPLHATDRNSDRGGNAVLIDGIPFSDLKTKRGHNLHTYWDKAFRFTGKDGAITELWAAPELPQRPKTPDEGVIAAQATKIVADFPPANFPELKTPASAATMAQETHRLGCKSAYPPGDDPADTGVRKLTPEFVQTSLPIARGRIALAGYRLAALLDSLFAP